MQVCRLRYQQHCHLLSLVRQLRKLTLLFGIIAAYLSQIDVASSDLLLFAVEKIIACHRQRRGSTLAIAIPRREGASVSACDAWRDVASLPAYQNSIDEQKRNHVRVNIRNRHASDFMDLCDLTKLQKLFTRHVQQSENS